MEYTITTLMEVVINLGEVYINLVDVIPELGMFI